MTGYIMVGGNLIGAAYMDYGWAYRCGVNDERGGFDHTSNPFSRWDDPGEADAWDAGWWNSWAGPL